MSDRIVVVVTLKCEEYLRMDLSMNGLIIFLTTLQ